MRLPEYLHSRVKYVADTVTVVAILVAGVILLVLLERTTIVLPIILSIYTELESAKRFDLFWMFHKIRIFSFQAIAGLPVKWRFLTWCWVFFG